MKTVTKKKLYEAMFLVDSADAGSDWDGIIAAIKKILKRAKVDIISIKKWDDRKLAYEIKGKSRGTYLLCYFRSDGQKNQEIETAVQLSERIIRVLILCVDWMTDEDIEKDTPATKAEKEREEREASAEAVEAEADPAAQASPEPAEEAAPVEAVTATGEAAVETDETTSTSEPAEEETEDSEKSQPKMAAEE